MKKALILILVTLFLVGILTACSSQGDLKEKDMNDDGTDAVLIDKNDNKDSTEKEPQFDAGSITYVTEFNNGLAFMEYNDDNNLRCIDKKGNQLFCLADYSIFSGGFVKFNGKLAMLETNKELILCDKKGKTYVAEDFGASRIVLDNENHGNAFMDGYIILERREETYKGTIVEMSVIDSDFNTLVPFSSEFTESYESIDSHWIISYYNGYLYNYSGILDLRTGEMLTDITQMKMSDMLLNYYAYGTFGGDFKHLRGGDIYNEVTGEVVAHIKENETISYITFVGDLGLAVHGSDNGYWFNIIDKDGASKFEPIKAEGSEIKFDGETILVSSYAGIVGKESVYVSSLKTYDINGISLGEALVEGTSFIRPQAEISDGIIITYDGDHYTLFNPELEELF